MNGRRPRLPMPRSARSVVAVTVVLGLVLALGAAGLVAAPAAEGLHYVAIGDSYTAGPSIPDQVGQPPGCARSDRNYPQRVAAALGATVVDASCSGATTADLVEPQHVAGGTNRPQLDAVDAGTDIVTVGIGGNDIGFGEIVVACVSLTPLGRPCRERFAPPGGDEISRRIAAAAPHVGAVLAEVRRRAPAADVYAVGYPAILPDQYLGCWPLMPFAFADVAYLGDRQRELNAMIAAQARANGAVYVDAYDASVGHDACALPGLRWVEGLVPLAPAAPLHPNEAGMQAMAEAVLAAVRAGD